MEFYENNEEKNINQGEKIETYNQETNKEEIPTKEENKKVKKKKILIISLVTIIMICVILFCCSIFAILNMNNVRIIKGVTINKINVEKLTVEEAIKKLEEEINNNIEKDIKIKYNDFEYIIKLSQIEAKYNIEDAVKKAQEVGRNKNIFEDNFNIIKTRLKRKNIDIEYSFNEELLNQKIEDISGKIPDAVIEPNYYIENEKLYISKGTKGNVINKNNLKEELIKALKESDKKEINLEVELKEPDDIDINKIHEEVYKEPKNAYYTKEPFEIFPHVDGVDFDIEAAKELLKEDKEEYEIKLTIIKPEVTTNKIGTEAFPDLISTFTTRYDSSNVPRSTNLKLAMQKLNGVVVSPGEICSYNKTLGKRTVAGGYKEAGGFAGGRVVQTLAGGICQISSTLYDAVVYANMEIIERYNHMFLAGYVGAGRDATVVYGSLDFKFKNTRKYPIMIKTYIGSGIATVEIYGVKEDPEYEVEISTKILNYIPYKVVYEDDSSLPEGTQKVVQNGMNGCNSITYKILKLNGKQVDSTVLSRDSYDAMNKIIKRGVKKTVTTSTTPALEEPAPQETPSEVVEQPVIPETNNTEENKHEETTPETNTIQTEINEISTETNTIIENNI